MANPKLIAQMAAKLAELSTAAPKEQKMLQGMYRGFAGDYNTVKAAEDSGLVYATPQRAAAEIYAKNRSKQAAKRGVDDTPHLEMLMVDPFAGRRYGHSTLGTGKQGPIRTLAGEYTPEQIGDVTQLYASGGPVKPTPNQDQMTHRRSSSQDQSTQPLTGSALQALVRGWMAETAGLPSLIEKGARYVDKYTTLNPDLRAMKSTDPVLPSGEFYREWLPGKQAGDEALTEVGGLLGGVGMGTLAKGIARAPGALSKVAQVAAANAAVPRALSAQAGVIKAPGGNWSSGSIEDSLRGLKRAENLDNPDQAKSLNAWINNKLAKYIQKEMATPEDPVRALAERGVLHYQPQPQIYGPGENAVRVRATAGFPEEGMAQSELAKNWEDITDRTLTPRPARSYQEEPDINERVRSFTADPWLHDAAPEAPIHAWAKGHRTSNLGFDHLTDELRNAMNPNSGLPAELLLKYGSLNQVSVPQAVERVSKINAWRAEQISKAKLAGMLKADVYKDYPEEAMRWVQLNKKGQFAAESDAMGHSVRGYEPPEGGGSSMYGLGGWDAIKSGKAKVYSLRDTKSGEPHVTIEVAPSGIITQIKGKSNKKPNDEYLPFVQDFVKSGKWSDVGDLQNSGLRKSSDVFGPTELQKFKENNVDIPSFLGADEQKALQDRWYTLETGKDPVTGYAEGGPVTQPKMTRDDFIKKYGTTFVANDKGGNAASEVAGQDVGAYYDTYLAPGAKTTQTVSHGWDNDPTEEPIDWGGAGRYSNSPQAQDADGFSAWDNVNPHPESNRGNGWDEAWKAVGRPIATAAAMYYGVGALNGLGAGAAAGTGGSAGIGSGTVLGGGAAVAPTAAGLAGTLGMAPGYMATALNTGALNTGMSLVRGKNIGDSLKTGATSALLSPISSYVGDAVGGGYTGQVAGNTVLGGVQGAINGQGFGKGLQDGLVNGLVSSAGTYMGGLAKGATGNNFAGTAANSLTQSTLRGRDPKATLDSLATQYASGELTDLTGLPPQVANLVVNLAQNRKPTASQAVGALSQMGNAVGSRKMKQTAVGG